MGYLALAVKVMIVSPNDCDDERDIIRAVIHEWNVIHSKDRSIVLLPVGWETHAAPAMGDRAQAILNKKILADCDLLVATFWTRLGTPTGDSPSGSVEEIREHLKAGKPAMVYFSSRLVDPEALDRAQYDALQTFKDECKAAGLIETYKTTDEFKEKFRRQLATTVPEHFTFDLSGPLGLLSTPSEPDEATLSSDAKELLLAASQDQNGIVGFSRTHTGSYLTAGGKDFGDTNTPRDVARWDAAMQEIENAGLIEALSYERQLFKLTKKGYSVADSLATP